MIKKIPYESSLICVGNMPVYDGKPVYSDGRVVYGWYYEQQKKKQAGSIMDGFWAADIVQQRYRLIKSDLSAGQWIAGKGFPVANYHWCYPWLAVDANYPNIGGTMKSVNGDSYQYEGRAVAMDETGRLLTYKAYQLMQYQADGTHVDTVLPYSRVSVFDYLYKDKYTGNSIYLDLGTSQTERSTDLRIFQLATVNGAYITYYDSNNNNGWTEAFVGNGSVTQRSYPTQVQLSQNAVLRLSDMALVMTDDDGTRTYANDPLGILGGQYSYPGGVHANGLYVSSQDSGKIFLEGRIETYNTLKYCYNLAYVKRRVKY